MQLVLIVSMYFHCTENNYVKILHILPSFGAMH